MFKDRADAGEKLAQALKKYKAENPLVLAIPRGGVEVGYHVAKELNAQFSIVVARKLPFPDNPEAGFGAIAEDGSLFIIKEYESILPLKVVEQTIKAERAEAKRRVKVLRGDKPLPEIKGRTVILIDDGIAMGVTMHAAIMLCRNKSAEKIIVAAPVSGPDVKKEMEKAADEVVILETPYYFRAVAQAYENWHDVQDDEVIKFFSGYGW